MSTMVRLRDLRALCVASILFMAAVSIPCAAAGSGPVWIGECDQAGANYGYSVGTAGDVNGDGYSDVIVAAENYDGTQPNAGRAQIYLGSATGLASLPAWTADGDSIAEFFGFSVSTAGDVNGDGYSDVIVASWGEANAGRISVYLGSATGPAASPAWTRNGERDDHFGWSVSTAGDVNGDGYSDIIVGEPYYDNGGSAEGRAYAFLGSASGLSLSPAWTVESDQAYAFFGRSVGTAGDVNGDGYSDVIVGAPYFDSGQGFEGRAYVYYGSPSGLASSPAWTMEGENDSSNLGTSVSTAGDVNGDGYSDVIIGADTLGESLSAGAFVFLGSASGLSASPAWIGESDQADSRYGSSVSTAGDVNRDGYSDVVVGAYYYANGQLREGRAYVYLGSASGVSASPVWVAEGNQKNPDGWYGYGWSVATAGDVDGDGYSDIVVGAPSYSNGQEFEGRAYVYGGPLVGVSLGGSVTGLAPEKVTCQNRTVGGKVVSKSEGETWDCGALGLVVRAGDALQTSARGVVKVGEYPVGGSVIGMSVTAVFCQNVTTGARLQVPTSAASWDCEALGLVAEPGETVVTGAAGTAD